LHFKERRVPKLRATWKSPFLVDIAVVNRAGKSIVLIGFMGSGKSLVGKVLEQKT
jgi:ABC-type polysaccharide/polyol phosphate transport system ATPase subunit